MSVQKKFEIRLESFGSIEFARSFGQISPSKEPSGNAQKFLDIEARLDSESDFAPLNCSRSACSELGFFGY
jgi:hypothetical protein